MSKIDPINRVLTIQIEGETSTKYALTDALKNKYKNRFFTLNEIVKRIDFSRNLLERLIRDGHLKKYTVKFFKDDFEWNTNIKTLIHKDDLKELLLKAIRRGYERFLTISSTKPPEDRTRFNREVFGRTETSNINPNKNRIYILKKPMHNKQIEGLIDDILVQKIKLCSVKTLTPMLKGKKTQKPFGTTSMTRLAQSVSTVELRIPSENKTNKNKHKDSTRIIFSDGNKGFFEDVVGAVSSHFVHEIPLKKTAVVRTVSKGMLSSDYDDFVSNFFSKSNFDNLATVQELAKEDYFLAPMMIKVNISYRDLIKENDETSKTS